MNSEKLCSKRTSEVKGLQKNNFILELGRTSPHVLPKCHILGYIFGRPVGAWVTWTLT